jgi:transcriptional regulator with XRE-family HTH domain
VDPSLALAILGQVIRELRAEKELSLTVLACQSKVTVSTLWRLEHGLVDPQWTTLNKILCGLEVSLGELAIRVVKQKLAEESGRVRAQRRRSL